MRTEPVKIYADASNAAVMRHPGRRFPGVLIQGDTLWNLCRSLDAAHAGARGRLDEAAFDELDHVRDQLRGLLAHYADALRAHGLELPFPAPPQGG
jgi:hypothetical protein